MRPHLFAFACALALGAVSTSAAAQAPDAEARARGQFKAAQGLYDVGDYASALPLFHEVSESSRSPNARLYAARCLRELGRLPEAYDEFATTATEASVRAEKEPRFASTRDAAAAEGAAIEPKIARVAVATVEKPLGLLVEVGGRTLAPSHVGRMTAVAPGTVIVKVIAPGFEPFEQTLTIEPGASATVAVALVPEEPEGAPAVVAPAPEEDRRSAPTSEPQAPVAEESHALRNVGFVVGGLGLVGVATFAIAGSMANSEYDALYDACAGGRCTDAGDADAIDSGKTLDLVANVGLVAGSAAILAGGAMIIFGTAGSGAASRTSLVVTPAGMSMGYRGVF